MSVLDCILVSCISSTVTSLVWFLAGLAQERKRLTEMADKAEEKKWKSETQP